MPYLFYVAHKDDALGLVLFGLGFILVSLVVAVFSAVLKALLRSAIEVKWENDLTV